MQQIVDLRNDPDFQSLDVQLVSIAFDSQEELTEMALEYDIGNIPLLTDSKHEVSEAYDVLQSGCFRAVIRNLLVLSVICYERGYRL